MEEGAIAKRCLRTEHLGNTTLTAYDAKEES
jgi:hypothetical protein